MIGFSGVPSVVSERGLNVKNELNCGFVRGLKAEEPGANLLVGEMTGRDDPEKHALTVLNATDHMDKNHAGSLCTVSFRTAARAVRLVSGGSTLPPDFSCVEDNGEKAVTFKLENCRCVMVELAF